jgi:nickel-dependent lactate racemase
MKIRLPYGPTPVEVEVPDDAEVAAPRAVERRDEGDVLRGALDRPAAGPNWRDFLAAPGPLLVVVNDATRPTPTARVLPRLAADLPADARFAVATGNHPAPTDAQLAALFGAAWETARRRLHLHDARDDAAHLPFGRTRRGTDCRFDRALADAARVLVLGSLEPHYFAGWTGGRKAFLPGLAARATTLANHALALAPGSAPGALAGNPVHEDMLEACALVTGKLVFSLQLVLDGAGRIYAAAGGDLRSSFEGALPAAREVYEIPIGARADVVVTVSPPPLDADLYQAHKAIENAKGALKPGGIMVLVAPCRDGVGDDDFLQVMKHYPNAAALLAGDAHAAHPGWHKAVKLAELARDGEIYAVTELPDEIARQAFMRPFRSLDAALAAALAARGPRARVVVVPAGSMSLPRPPEA